VLVVTFYLKRLRLTEAERFTVIFFQTFEKKIEELTVIHRHGNNNRQESPEDW
jgi:hypothetical protein